MKQFLPLLLCCALLFPAHALASDAKPDTALLEAKALMRQNAALSSELATLKKSYEDAAKDIWKNVETTLIAYEKSVREIMENNAQNSQTPPFMGFGVGPAPLVNSTLQEVLFVVTDSKKQPVLNLQLEVSPRDEGTKPQSTLSSFYDDRQIETTDYKGRTTRRLPVGDYTATLRFYADSAFREKTADFSVKAKGLPQEISLLWTGQTPAQYFGSLKNRLEITVTDQDGEPVTGIVGAYQSKTSSWVENDIAIIPTVHPDKNGTFIFTLPSKKEGRLLLESDRITEAATGKRQYQSLSVSLSRLSGVVRLKATFKPSESDIHVSVQGPAVDTSALDALSAEELAVRAAQLRGQNSKLRREVEEISDKWDTLSERASLQTQDGKKKIEKKLGYAPPSAPTPSSESDSSAGSSSAATAPAEN